jgi:hypothetical protein
MKTADETARKLAAIIIDLHRRNIDIGELVLDQIEVVGEDNQPQLSYSWEDLLDALIPKDPAEPRAYLRAAIVAHEDALVAEQLAAMLTPKRPRARRAA